MQVDPSRAAWRLFLIALACGALAAAAFGTARLAFGPRPVYVNIRWAPEVDETTRQQLEGRYSLLQGELREGRTWGYALADRSRDNIRAIVGDPAVEDTHQIHRTAFRVWHSAARLPYRTPRPWIPVGLEIVALAGLALGLLAGGLGLVQRVTPRLVGGPLAWLRTVFLQPGVVGARIARRLLRWGGARIPPASAEAAGAFRIVFGSALLLFLLSRRLGAGNLDPTDAALLLEPFRRAPWLADWLTPWLVAWGLLFIAGAAARTSYAMLTAGVLVWAGIYTIDVSHHTVSALLLTLVCLLGSRWGDAWSVDAWRGRRARTTPRAYGFTVWAPGFVLGVTYAGAACAKLVQGGLGWITNGTVKYHFLSDSGQALVDWGLRLASNHAVAVLLSFGAIAIESLVIVGVCARAYRYRLMAGMGALLLLSGFVLFQGIFWPAWWILLLSFLPWHLVQPDAAAAAPALEPPAGAPVPWRRLVYPAILVLAVGTQQAVMSLFRLELSPLLSTYDMYSTTYDSPAVFEEKATDALWLVVTDETGRRRQCRITPVEAEDLTAEAWASAGRKAGTATLDRCVPPSVRVRTITVEATRIRVDWARWRMEEAGRVPLRSFDVTDR